jgi:hypothetical protein
MNIMQIIKLEDKNSAQELNYSIGIIVQSIWEVSKIEHQT